MDLFELRDSWAVITQLGQCFWIWVHKWVCFDEETERQVLSWCKWVMRTVRSLGLGLVITCIWGSAMRKEMWMWEFYNVLLNMSCLVWYLCKNANGEDACPILH